MSHKQAMCIMHNSLIKPNLDSKKVPSRSFISTRLYYTVLIINHNAPHMSTDNLK